MPGPRDETPLGLPELEQGESPRAKALLDRLDSAAAALPDGLDDAKADALVRAALPSAVNTAPVRSRWRLVATGAALGLAAALALGFVLLPEDWPEPGVLAVMGDVSFDGQPLRPLQGPVPLGRASVVKTGESGAAAIHRSGGTLLLARSSSMKGRELLSGAVLVEGSRLKVAAHGLTVVVDGRTLVTMEPAAELVRVTPSEDTMKNDWMKLGPAFAGVGAAAVLGVLVLDGDATILAAEAAPVKVKAGEQWSAGDKTVRPAAPAATALEPEALAHESLQPMSRDQLVAHIEALRNEKEALLRERAVLRRSVEELQAQAAPPSSSTRKLDTVDDPKQPRNYFQLTPEELKASAEKGELRLRVALGEEVPKVDLRAADETGLTAAERTAIDGLYSASKQRLLAGMRELYVESGGNAQVSWELSDETLLREIREKAIKGDYSSAIRQLANERAGLQPKTGPGEGPTVLRAFRLVLEEDERFVAEVTALLGPRRAEAFLNHPGTPHSDNVFGVGPAKKLP